MRLGLVRVACAALALATVTGVETSASASVGARSWSCSRQADQQRLKGHARAAFRARCLRAAPAPGPLSSAKAVTDPSGADKMTRSRQCDAQAAKEGLHDNALQAFRKSCLASAAPTGAVGSMDRQPVPTPAQRKLDALTDAPRR
jgi:hypothetical protein